MAFKTKDNIIGVKTIFDSELDGDNIMVLVDVVVDGDCAILIPTKKGINNMSQEVGSHILWPHHLVFINNEKVMHFLVNDIHVTLYTSLNCNICGRSLKN